MKRYLHLELEGRRTAKIVRTEKTAKLAPGEVMMMVEGMCAEEPVDDMRFVVLPVKDAFDDMLATIFSIGSCSSVIPTFWRS